MGMAAHGGLRLCVSIRADISQEIAFGYTVSTMPCFVPEAGNRTLAAEASVVKGQYDRGIGVQYARNAAPFPDHGILQAKMPLWN